MSQATTDIDQRRRAQDRQHGGPAHDDRHTPEAWVAILAKFLGRAADAAPLHGRNPKAYRDAMIDIAAVAQAAAESFDRKGGF